MIDQSVLGCTMIYSIFSDKPMRNQADSLLATTRDGVMALRDDKTEPEKADGDAQTVGEGLVAVGGLLLVISCLGPLAPYFQMMGICGRDFTISFLWSWYCKTC